MTTAEFGVDGVKLSATCASLRRTVRSELAVQGRQLRDGATTAYVLIPQHPALDARTTTETLPAALALIRLMAVVVAVLFNI